MEAGNSSITSSHWSTSLAPCLMSRFGPKLCGDVIFPGTAKTSRFCSSASRAVMSEPLYSSLHNDHAQRKAADDPVADGEVFRRRVRAQAKLRNQRSIFDHLVRQLYILARVNHIHSRA